MPRFAANVICNAPKKQPLLVRRNSHYNIRKSPKTAVNDKKETAPALAVAPPVYGIDVLVEIGVAVVLGTKPVVGRGVVPLEVTSAKLAQVMRVLLAK